jgi:diguanylate cyclase (GGDEF)-like protein
MWLVAMLFVMSSMTMAVAQQTGKVVRADFTKPHIDVVPFLGAVQSDKRQVIVKLPAGTSGLTENMTLTATGPGPEHRWAIFTTANPTNVPRELVVDAARQSFPGSGIVSPSYSSSRISAAASTQSIPLRRLATPDRDAFAFTVPPNTSFTVALELSEVGVSGVRLWQRGAFDRNALRQALYRGIVVGMAILAVVVITCLVVLSPQIVFPLSMIFAWPAVAFITLETGQLEAALKAISPFPVPRHEVLSGIIEALMMAGIMLMGVTIMRTRRQLPVLSVLLMVAGGAGLALAGYALVEPVLVKQLARIGFALGVAIVLIAAGVLIKRGGVRARSSLMVWMLLAVWSVVAAYIALVRPPHESASAILVGGLALVLVALAFVLTYFAFSNVLNPEGDTLAAERNALALASASQVVWDYHPGDNTFFVGRELEQVLGYEPGTVNNTSAREWVELIHPNDQAAYFATVETTRQRGDQQFEQQLRLRHADGRYRWYGLKGRSLLDAAESGLRLAGTLSDASQQRNSQDRMLSDAIYDVVTGLPNHALYLDRLRQFINRANAVENARLNVVIVDIDRFRVVNNRLGQEIGDSLLRTIARRLEKLLPETGSLARMPGDQFVIIHETSNDSDPLEEATIFVDLVRHSLSRPVRVPPNEIYLTCCVGIAHWDARMEDAEALHRCAEIALFDAKKRGKDKVAFYKPGMRLEPESTGLSVEDLQSALQERRFELVYQPIMRLSDNQLAGFEALIRLRLRDGTLRDPSSFVPLAERCGLIGDIGAFVLSEAARQLGVWQRMFTPIEPVFVSVNVSSAQLIGPRLLHLAKTILSREELVPGSLKLEITETLVMENPELSLQMLDRLKAMGLGLSCDDFGTGYSSLSYLRRLPFDTLKVDRSFLQAGLEDERGSVVLDAIILLAHDLGLSVVVEGVETQSQLDHLVALECDLAQGFLIGEPIDAQHVQSALGAPSRDPAYSQSGITALWARLTSKPAAAPPAPPVPEPEPEVEEDALVPWSPYDFHPAPWAPRVAAPASSGKPEYPHEDEARASQINELATVAKPEDTAVEEDISVQPAGIETISRQVSEALAETEAVAGVETTEEIIPDPSKEDAPADDDASDVSAHHEGASKDDGRDKVSAEKPETGVVGGKAKPKKQAKKPARKKTAPKKRTSSRKAKAS